MRLLFVSSMFFRSVVFARAVTGAEVSEVGEKVRESKPAMTSKIIKREMKKRIRWIQTSSE